MIDLDKDIELYKSKVAFYESQNTRGEYAVTVRELKFVVETLETLRLERSQGDLISREWVKTNFAKEFFKAIGSGNDTSFEVFGTVKKVIDNAPTVEPRIEYGTDGQPYKLSMTNGKEYERPKGEWVLVHPLQENDEGAYMCSVCHTGDWCISPEFKFCPYCGAEMKEGDK